jgi:Leucine-rich repeat (LRR) protein
LEGDRFKKLPDEISRLKNLQSLYLRNNDITELPATIRFLKKLEYIDLTDNKMPHILLDQYREDLAPTIRIRF